MYALIKKLLFMLDPERSHYLALQSIAIAHRSGLLKLLPPVATQPKKIFGLHFPNAIGLAAGLDKNADYVDALGALGFGFIEVGTVTPKPQIGNSRPRLFRLTQHEAIINRMGFNNKGIDHVIQRLQKSRYRGILGINIGKNKDTPLEAAINDYVIGFQQLWPYASYITINISSPNTPNLRDLQQTEWLAQLLNALKKAQTVVAKQKYVPLIVKIAPDLSEPQLAELADVLVQEKMDGVIATNTTLNRNGVLDSPFAQESGGLSGRPLHEQSTKMVALLQARLQGRLPIIASGGIMDAISLKAKQEAGAELFQIYSGFIYRGPGLIRQLLAST